MPQEPSPQQIADQKIYRQMGLIPSEYNCIVELLGRQPNYTETGIFAVMWSEHCSYKNSKPLLKLFPTEGSQVLQGPGEGKRQGSGAPRVRLGRRGRRLPQVDGESQERHPQRPSDQSPPIQAHAEVLANPKRRPIVDAGLCSAVLRRDLSPG